MNTLHNTYTLFLLLFCILGSILFLSGCVTEEIDHKVIHNDFSFTTITGETKHLSDYLGKVVVLDLWAIWCQPCQIQMTELYEAYNYYSKDEFEILSINIEPQETSTQITEFLEEVNGYGYDLDWVFGIDTDGNIWETYQVGRGGIPAIIIFDKNGEIQFTHEGFVFFSTIPEGAPQGMTTLAPIIDQLL